MKKEDPNAFNEFHIVEKDGKYGIIDSLTDEVVVDYVFNDIKWQWFSVSSENWEKKCMACLRLGTRWGVIPYYKLHDLKKP